MRQVQNQSQQQKMSLTQQMRSSLSLLQMGPAQIAETLEEELPRNPFLRPVPAPPGGSSGGGAELPESTPAQELSHAQSLLAQIALIRLSPDEAKLATELVYCLDERGFFEDPRDQMCGYLNTSAALLDQVVAKLQQAVEPAGVFTWSLRESFTVQLQAQNRYDPLIEALLNRIDLIAKSDIAGICEHCGVDAEDAEDMLADIRSLSPAPLTPVPDLTITARAPDLIMRPDEDGVIQAMLNPAALPDLLTDDALFDTLKTSETDSAALAYYRDCYRGAGAFVVAMQKRANTLLRIGQQIAETQQAYFRTGRPLDRKPLTMGSMAQDLGVNKSTISRAMNNCTIECSHGVIAATDMLVRPISDDAGEKTRDQALKRLSLLIRTEDKNMPLSDQALADQMCKLNLGISRRTVAKYRAILGLPNATERRTAARH